MKIDAGILSFQITELDITCLPKDLPEYIAVDVSGLALNQSIHLSDIQLPEGVELTASALHAGDDPTLANVAPPKVMEEEEETLEEGLEVELGGDPVIVRVVRMAGRGVGGAGPVLPRGGQQQRQDLRAVLCRAWYDALLRWDRILDIDTAQGAQAQVS